jgi:hypothetical protein
MPVSMELCNMDKSSVEIYGLPWYRLKDYATIRRIMADGHNLPYSFAIWRLSAKHGEKRLKQDGKMVVRVLIDPEAFRRWCEAHSLDLNSTARFLYAGHFAKHHASTLMPLDSNAVVRAAD